MTTQHTFATEDLCSGYGDTRIVDEISLTIPANQMSVIVGANACGKSTLLKTLSRLISPQSGTVVLDGKKISEIPTKELARTLGLLPQQPVAPEGIIVSDLVGRGRHPHQKLFKSWSSDDDHAVVEALAMTGITDLANRSIDELSGGQRQRVWISMVLAQQTDLLLLDEPTTFLDVTTQIEVLDLLTDLNRARGTTIVMVLHDLNLAARYADHLFAVCKGKLVAHGAPGEVLTAPRVKEVWDLDAQIISDPVSGTPLVLPIGRHHVLHPESSHS